MYISSVFSHLERETIGERVKDNMYQLARTGRWLGGKTPTGFKSEPITYFDHDGNKKKMYKLTPIPEELDLIKLLFTKYTEFKSLTKLESWALENNIKTKNDKDFDKSTLKVMLTNPVYAIADKDLYEYFKGNGSDIANTQDEFDGLQGLMVFNKYDEKKKTVIKKDKAEWIVAIGKHEGVIPSQDWVLVQNLLESNSKKCPRRETKSAALLMDVLRCKNCNTKMKVSIYQRGDTSYFYYRCPLKERSRGSRCDVKNLNGKVADRFVISEITKISFKEHDVHQFLAKLKDDVKHLKSNNKSKKSELEKTLHHYQSSIQNLTMQLAQNSDPTVSKYIIDQIKEFDHKINEVNLKLKNINTEKESIHIKQADIEIILSLIKHFCKNVHRLSLDEKKKLFSQIVDNITWDGTQIEINILSEDATV